MRRILIFYPPNKLGMSDFGITDYSTIAQRAAKELNGKIPNFGNMVWLQGIISEISQEGNHYDFGYEELSVDFINQNYDCVLLPLANCFHKGWIPYLEKRASYIEKIKIPVYVIACGVQAGSYDEIGKLIDEVKEPAVKFIKSVYNTGGEFALRGYFTKEFFERLGFHSAVVTGCPSIFQMGRDLSITNEKVDERDFVATINGTFDLPAKKKDLLKADFICQDVNGKILYDPGYFKSTPFDLRRMLKYVRRNDYVYLNAIANNKIQLFANTQHWLSYYIKNKVNFSFGSRIHGTIMPILAQVPSLCYTKDARTREMVEFFDIPHIKHSENKEVHTLYEWYCLTDYTDFNKNYSKRFDEFEAFLKKCGLVDKINQNNTFMSRTENVEMPTKTNQKEIEKVGNEMKKYKWILSGADALLNK